MKKENIVWVIFPVIWCFWLFGMKGHTGYWNGTGFFQCGAAYWSEYALRPGGWTDYAGHFLLQFYQWAAVGALIQTLLAGVIFVLVRKIIQSLGILKNGIFFTCLPVMLVFILQVGGWMLVSESLKVVLFFSLILIYLQFRNPQGRCILFTLLFPLELLLLGVEGITALYINLVIYELWRGQNMNRWIRILIWLLLITIIPEIWRRWLYVMPRASLFSLAITADYLKFLLYVYLIILWVAAWVASRYVKNKSFFWFGLFLILAGATVGTYLAYDASSERFFRMEQLAGTGEWEELLRLADEIKQPGREEMFLINLALARRGELGERLLDYPADWGIGGLYLPRGNDYQVSISGSELYVALNIPNEAIHWTFQAAVASPEGMNFRTLKQLIELNILKRDSLLADKYLTVLENTVGYGQWCRVKRLQWANPIAEKVLPEDKIDFFIGGRPFLSDLARIFDTGRSRKITGDYLLCGLLLKKDLSKFSTLFRMVYPSATEKIPRIYQEALLVCLAIENKDINSIEYQINPEIARKFQQYSNLYSICKNKQNAKELLKEFKNTWWYYFHVVEPYPIDEKGNSVLLLMH